MTNTIVPPQRALGTPRPALGQRAKLGAAASQLG